MSWAALLDLIADELGNEAAERVEKRARLHLGGLRITIAQRPVITNWKLQETSPGKLSDAARELGVSKSTVYRLIHRTRLLR